MLAAAASLVLAPDLVLGWSPSCFGAIQTLGGGRCFAQGQKRYCNAGRVSQTRSRACSSRGRRGGVRGAPWYTARSAIETGGEDGDGDDNIIDDSVLSETGREASVSRTIIEGIEDAVRSAGLGDENYRFGDLSRRAVSDFKSATEDAVRAATGDENYHFGDLTKRAVSDLTKTTEDTVKAVTKNEEFKLGYYAEVWKREQDRRLGDLITDLLGDYNIPVVENLTPTQRRGLVRAAIQMLALGCLCLNFVMNVFSGVTVVSAWAATVSKTGTSPLSSSVSWSAFLSAHSTLRIFTGPATMPVQCVVALFLSPRYRKWLLWLQMYLASMTGRKDVRLRDRVGAVGIAWLFLNCLGIATVTLGGIWIVGAALGVPLRL